MTALLTDAMLSDICHKNIGVQGATGAVAREVRSIYEARLAEAAKVRAGLVEALKAIKADAAYQKRSGGAYFTSAPTEYEMKADHARRAWKMVNAALAAAKEIK